MKRISLTLAALVFTAAAPARGQSTATQTVSFEVQSINQLSVSGNPSSLVINTATAGSAPTSVSNTATTWAITTNNSNKTVTAQINTAMPSGVTLTLGLAAPTGATGSTVSLGVTAANVVTGITQLNASGLTITYTLSATAAAGVVSPTTRTVTLTII